MSFLWSNVYAFLSLEVLLTLFLVIPVPRRYRNWVCRQAVKLNLKEKSKSAIRVIGVFLALGFVDCVNALRFIWSLEKDTHDRSPGGDGGAAHQVEKEREYKIERNLYMVGFALTLLFVLGRIFDLMHEHVVMEDELDKIRSGETPVEGTSGEPNSSEIEMKPVQDKKKD